MTAIGETLRRERLKRNIDLEQISQELKISARFLEAIEEEKFDRLPGGVFARSFVRQYARLLELDEEEILAELKKQFEEPADAAPVAAPQPPPHLPYLPTLDDLRDRLRSDSSLSALVWVVIAVLMCAGIYSLWQRGRRSESRVAVAAAPQAAPVPHETVSAGVKPKGPAEPTKSDFTATEVADNGTIRVPAEGAQGPETAANPEGVAAAMHVAFIASEPVWVSIKSDGARAYIGMIEGQQSKQFDASRKM